MTAHFGRNLSKLQKIGNNSKDIMNFIEKYADRFKEKNKENEDDPSCNFKISETKTKILLVFSSFN